MKKIIAGVLYFIAAWLILAAVLSAATRVSHGLTPDYGIDLFLLALGAVMIWGGTRIWKRA